MKVDDAGLDLWIMALCGLVEPFWMKDGVDYSYYQITVINLSSLNVKTIAAPELTK